MKSKVYFSKEITPEKVVELYKQLGAALPGKVAVKVHSGEEGNQNFLRPPFWKPMIDLVQGT
ncbi:MAG: ferredoxin, partial [Lachnospiraceae bacterium]|nr:ferredoxin [Lachnospiraceae bacterium]